MFPWFSEHETPSWCIISSECNVLHPFIDACVFCRTTRNTFPRLLSIPAEFIGRKKTYTFKARLPHEQGRFILFVCSARQIHGGKGICESSRERDSFCDFIIDLPIYVMPCSGGSAFVLFVFISLSDAASLFYRGRADGLICRERGKRKLNAKSHSC